MAQAQRVRALGRNCAARVARQGSRGNIDMRCSNIGIFQLAPLHVRLCH
jgi:hypothetical protein